MDFPLFVMADGILTALRMREIIHVLWTINVIRVFFTISSLHQVFSFMGPYSLGVGSIFLETSNRSYHW